MDLPLAIEIFSAPRFARYLDASNGDAALAVELYRWNVELSTAYFELIAYLEVAVRNACHAVLADSQSTSVGIPWYLDPEVLSSPALATVNGIRDRVRAESGSESPDRVIAGLSFGFWRGLLDRKNEQLWIERLYPAFPAGDGKRRTISAPMGGLHTFRNRLAHHEPIFHFHEKALDRRREEIDIIANAISKDFTAWIASVDRTEVARNARPT